MSFGLMPGCPSSGFLEPCGVEKQSSHQHGSGEPVPRGSLVWQPAWPSCSSFSPPMAGEELQPELNGADFCSTPDSVPCSL